MDFEVITFAPIDLDAIDVGLMMKDEIEYLNNYHKKVYEKISPFLNQDEKEWLKKYTREI
jgi:Xaa-Pro aminopeptidase